MATGKLDVKGLVSEARQQGYTDQQIYNELQKTPQFSNLTKEAKGRLKLSDSQVASQFGLVIKAVNNASNRRNFTPFDNTKEARNAREQEQLKKQGKTQFWESGLLGFADVGAPFVQAASWAGDKISEGVNAVAGTKLRTDSYKAVTKGLKNASDNHNTVRKANNQGFDITRMGANMLLTAPVAATGGTLKAGMPLASKAGAEFLGKNAALGALIGATGIHENNKQRLQSMAAGGIGGALGAAAGQKLGEGVTRVAQKTRNTVAKFSPTETNQILRSIDSKLGTTQINVDVHLNKALESKGIKIADLSDDIAKSLRADAKQALNSGNTLNPDAVARKVVLERLGIKGTRAQITGNGKIWQKEAELAKIQGAGDDLRDVLIRNEDKVMGTLEGAIAKTGGNSIDQYGVAREAAETLLTRNKQNKEFIGSAYDIARKAKGNDAVLDGKAFADEANNLLTREYATLSLPSSVKKMLKDVTKNPDDFTLNKADEYIKLLNREYKSSLDMNKETSASYAIGLVRDALNKRQATALQGLTGNESAQAYQFARQAHKANAELTQQLPLLQDTLKGVEPDKLFNKHILGGNVNELSKTIEVLNTNNPQAVRDIQQQTLQWIYGKARNTNGSPSPKNMDSALKAIGDRRLNIIFSPEQVKLVKDLNMAMEYLVTQPKHSYVNNSNTGSAIANHVGAIVDKLGKFGLHLPWVSETVVKPLQSSGQRISASRAVKATASLASETKLPTSNISQSVIDQLTKLGLIGGANLQE